MAESLAGDGGFYYAGFWRRVLAYIIDAIILGIINGVIYLIVGVPIFDQVASPEEVQAMMARMNLASVISLIIIWLYYAGFEASALQATPGKLAIGLKVTDLRGNRIGFGRASIRFWGKIISTIILFIGFLMVAFTQRKQGLHDMMASCLVLRKPFPR